MPQYWMQRSSSISAPTHILLLCVWCSWDHTLSLSWILSRVIFFFNYTYFPRTVCPNRAHTCWCSSLLRFSAIWSCVSSSMSKVAAGGGFFKKIWRRPLAYDKTIGDSVMHAWTGQALYQWQTKPSLPISLRERCNTYWLVKHRDMHAPITFTEKPTHMQHEPQRHRHVSDSAASGCLSTGEVKKQSVLAVQYLLGLLLAEAHCNLELCLFIDIHRRMWLKEMGKSSDVCQATVTDFSSTTWLMTS